MAIRLEVELVPKTAWWSNVRSNVSRADWEKCKRFVRERSGDRCEICGGHGKRWPVECHEIWSYDDDNLVQALVGLIALCPRCHLVKHFGRAQATGRGVEAFMHLQKVNGWTDEATLWYLDTVFALWHLRSTYQWDLNISFLSFLGINAEVKDRT